MRYRRRRPDDGELRERLSELAAQRRPFGYRRLWVLLRRDGHAVNKKRVYRLYRQERLMVRRRSGRKRASGRARRCRRRRARTGAGRSTSCMTR